MMRRAQRTQRTLLRQLRDTGVSIGSAAGTAALTYALLPLGLIGVAVLCAHELGHYLVARALGLTATLPVFIPLGILTLGFTRVYGTHAPSLAAVGWAGPAAGLTVAATMAAAAMLGGYAPAVWFALFACGTELWNLCFGTDKG